MEVYMTNEDKINNLDVSDSWKAKLITIDRAKPISFGFIPKFENCLKKFKGGQK
jgi:hypothetical protein